MQSECNKIVGIPKSANFYIFLGDINNLFHADMEELTNEQIKMKKYKESGDYEFSETPASNALKELLRTLRLCSNFF